MGFGYCGHDLCVHKVEAYIVSGVVLSLPLRQNLQMESKSLPQLLCVIYFPIWVSYVNEIRIFTFFYKYDLYSCH